MPPAAPDKEESMTDIVFERITPEESRVYFEGGFVGEVHRQDDILNPGSHYYMCWLDEDPPRPRAHPSSARGSVMS